MLDKVKESPLVCYRLCQQHGLGSHQRTSPMITDFRRYVHVIVDDLLLCAVTAS